MTAADTAALLESTFGAAKKLDALPVSDFMAHWVV